MELQRNLYRWQFLVAWTLLIGSFWQGFHAFQPGSKAFVSPETTNVFLAFIYALGEGPNVLLPGVFPLIAVLFAGDSLAWDRRTGYEQAILLRTSYKRYIVGKALAAAATSGGLVFITEVLAFLYGLAQFSTVSHPTPSVLAPTYAPQLFFYHPWLYVGLLMINTALLAAVVSVFALMLSTWIPNAYIVAGIPWVLFFVLQFGFYAMGWIAYAPIDLVGAYVVSYYHHPTLGIPILWLGLAGVFVLGTYGSYAKQFWVREP